MAANPLFNNSEQLAGFLTDLSAQDLAQYNNLMDDAGIERGLETREQISRFISLGKTEQLSDNAQSLLAELINQDTNASSASLRQAAARFAESPPPMVSPITEPTDSSALVMPEVLSMSQIGFAPVSNRARVLGFRLDFYAGRAELLRLIGVDDISERGSRLLRARLSIRQNDAGEQSLGFVIFDPKNEATPLAFLPDTLQEANGDYVPNPVFRRLFNDMMASSRSNDRTLTIDSSDMLSNGFEILFDYENLPGRQTRPTDIDYNASTANGDRFGFLGATPYRIRSFADNKPEHWLNQALGPHFTFAQSLPTWTPAAIAAGSDDQIAFDTFCTREVNSQEYTFYVSVDLLGRVRVLGKPTDSTDWLELPLHAGTEPYRQLVETSGSSVPIQVLISGYEGAFTLGNLRFRDSNTLLLSWFDTLETRYPFKNYIRLVEAPTETNPQPFSALAWQSESPIQELNAAFTTRQIDQSSDVPTNTDRHRYSIATDGNLLTPLYVESAPEGNPLFIVDIPGTESSSQPDSGVYSIVLNFGSGDPDIPIEFRFSSIEKNTDTEVTTLTTTQVNDLARDRRFALNGFPLNPSWRARLEPDGSIQIFQGSQVIVTLREPAFESSRWFDQVLSAIDEGRAADQVFRIRAGSGIKDAIIIAPQATAYMADEAIPVTGNQFQIIFRNDEGVIFKRRLILDNPARHDLRSFGVGFNAQGLLVLTEGEQNEVVGELSSLNSLSLSYIGQDLAGNPFLNNKSTFDGLAGEPGQLGANSFEVIPLTNTPYQADQLGFDPLGPHALLTQINQLQNMPEVHPALQTIQIEGSEKIGIVVRGIKGAHYFLYLDKYTFPGKGGDDILVVGICPVRLNDGNWTQRRGGVQFYIDRLHAVYLQHSQHDRPFPSDVISQSRLNRLLNLEGNQNLVDRLYVATPLTNAIQRQHLLRNITQVTATAARMPVSFDGGNQVEINEPPALVEGNPNQIEIRFHSTTSSRRQFHPAFGLILAEGEASKGPGELLGLSSNSQPADLPPITHVWFGSDSATNTPATLLQVGSVARGTDNQLLLETSAGTMTIDRRGRITLPQTVRESFGRFIAASNQPQATASQTQAAETQIQQAFVANPFRAITPHYHRDGRLTAIDFELRGLAGANPQEQMLTYLQALANEELQTAWGSFIAAGIVSEHEGRLRIDCSDIRFHENIRTFLTKLPTAMRDANIRAAMQVAEQWGFQLPTEVRTQTVEIRLGKGALAQDLQLEFEISQQGTQQTARLLALNINGAPYTAARAALSIVDGSDGYLGIEQLRSLMATSLRFPAGHQEPLLIEVEQANMDGLQRLGVELQFTEEGIVVEPTDQRSRTWAELHEALLGVTPVALPEGSSISNLATTLGFIEPAGVFGYGDQTAVITLGDGEPRLLGFELESDYFSGRYGVLVQDLATGLPPTAADFPDTELLLTFPSRTELPLTIEYVPAARPEDRRLALAVPDAVEVEIMDGTAMFMTGDWIREVSLDSDALAVDAWMVTEPADIETLRALGLLAQGVDLDGMTGDGLVLGVTGAELYRLEFVDRAEFLAERALVLVLRDQAGLQLVDQLLHPASPPAGARPNPTAVGVLTGTALIQPNNVPSTDQAILDTIFQSAWILDEARATEPLPLMPGSTDFAVVDARGNPQSLYEYLADFDTLAEMANLYRNGPTLWVTLRPTTPGSIARIWMPMRLVGTEDGYLVLDDRTLRVEGEGGTPAYRRPCAVVEYASGDRENLDPRVLLGERGLAIGRPGSLNHARLNLSHPQPDSAENPWDYSYLAGLFPGNLPQAEITEIQNQQVEQNQQRDDRSPLNLRLGRFNESGAQELTFELHFGATTYRLGGIFATAVYADTTESILTPDRVAYHLDFTDFEIFDAAGNRLAPEGLAIDIDRATGVTTIVLNNDDQIELDFVNGQARLLRDGAQPAQRPPVVVSSGLVPQPTPEPSQRRSPSTNQATVPLIIDTRDFPVPLASNPSDIFYGQVVIPPAAQSLETLTGLDVGSTGSLTPSAWVVSAMNQPGLGRIEGAVFFVTPDVALERDLVWNAANRRWSIDETGSATLLVRQSGAWHRYQPAVTRDPAIARQVETIVLPGGRVLAINQITRLRVDSSAQAETFGAVGMAYSVHAAMAGSQGDPSSDAAENLGEVSGQITNHARGRLAGLQNQLAGELLEALPTQAGQNERFTLSFNDFDYLLKVQLTELPELHQLHIIAAQDTDGQYWLVPRNDEAPAIRLVHGGQGRFLLFVEGQDERPQAVLYFDGDRRPRLAQLPVMELEALSGAVHHAEQISGEGTAYSNNTHAFVFRLAGLDSADAHIVAATAYSASGAMADQARLAGLEVRENETGAIQITLMDEARFNAAFNLADHTNPVVFHAGNAGIRVIEYTNPDQEHCFEVRILMARRSASVDGRLVDSAYGDNRPYLVLRYEGVAALREARPTDVFSILAYRRHSALEGVLRTGTLRVTEPLQNGVLALLANAQRQVLQGPDADIAEGILLRLQALGRQALLLPPANEGLYYELAAWLLDYAHGLGADHPLVETLPFNLDLQRNLVATFAATLEDLLPNYRLATAFGLADRHGLTPLTTDPLAVVLNPESSLFEGTGLEALVADGWVFGMQPEPTSNFLGLVAQPPAGLAEPEIEQALIGLETSGGLTRLGANMAIAGFEIGMIEVNAGVSRTLVVRNGTEFIGPNTEVTISSATAEFNARRAQLAAERSAIVDRLPSLEEIHLALAVYQGSTGLAFAAQESLLEAALLPSAEAGEHLGQLIAVWHLLQVAPAGGGANQNNALIENFYRLVAGQLPQLLRFALLYGDQNNNLARDFLSMAIEMAVDTSRRQAVGFRTALNEALNGVFVSGSNTLKGGLASIIRSLDMSINSGQPASSPAPVQTEGFGSFLTQPNLQATITRMPQRQTFTPLTNLNAQAQAGLVFDTMIVPRLEVAGIDQAGQQAMRSAFITEYQIQARNNPSAPLAQRLGSVLAAVQANPEQPNIPLRNQRARLAQMRHIRALPRPVR